MNNIVKKSWRSPQLIRLARQEQAENILVGCKSTALGNHGPNSLDSYCIYDGGGCGACNVDSPS